MTVIVFRKSVSGGYREMKCEGHAGFDEYGSDIVCASISMLVINTLNALDELCKIPLQVSEDEQEGVIECTFPDYLDEKATILLDALVLGLTSVQKQYGKKYCKVKIEEV